MDIVIMISSGVVKPLDKQALELVKLEAVAKLELTNVLPLLLRSPGGPAWQSTASEG